MMEKKIAKDLLKIKAVFFRPDEPFTWASGIKSPVYCDNRLTLTAPDVRLDVEEGLAELIKTHYPEAEVLMGTSTAGIAHAAITAHILNMPMGYVRSGAKDHGRQNQIEGRLEKGQKVVVVEDLISTGGSVIEVVNVLREAGAEVLGVVSIFTYGMKKGLERLAEAQVKNISLTNFDVVAQDAAEEGYIAPEKLVQQLGHVLNDQILLHMADPQMLAPQALGVTVHHHGHSKIVGHPAIAEKSLDVPGLYQDHPEHGHPVIEPAGIIIGGVGNAAPFPAFSDSAVCI